MLVLAVISELSLQPYGNLWLSVEVGNMIPEMVGLPTDPNTGSFRMKTPTPDFSA